MNKERTTDNRICLEIVSKIGDRRELTESECEHVSSCGFCSAKFEAASSGVVFCAGQVRRSIKVLASGASDAGRPRPVFLERLATVGFSFVVAIMLLSVLTNISNVSEESRNGSANNQKSAFEPVFTENFVFPTIEEELAVSDPFQSTADSGSAVFEPAEIDQDWYYGEETSPGLSGDIASNGQFEKQKSFFSDAEAPADRIASNHYNENGFDYFEYNRQLISQGMEVAEENFSAEENLSKDTF